MGRGGTGNIEAATVQQGIPFDISKDPDDSYEDIIREKAQKARMHTRVCGFLVQ